MQEFCSRLLDNTFIVLIGYFVLVNLMALLLMAIDKQKARKDRFRIPEAVLFLSAIIGGSIGSLAGMFLFHHKTRKWKFRIGMPLILLLQVGLVLFLSFGADVTIQ